MVPVHSIDDTGHCTCTAPECVAPGRHPRVRWEESQRLPASDEKLREWFSHWPESNVGVVTGSVSGLAVIDVDPHAGGAETLAEAVAEYGALAATAQVAGGNGHRQLYLAYVSARGHTLASGPLGPGLQLEADGGFVLAPPSCHESGGESRWVVGPSTEEPLGALPAWAYLRAGADLEDASPPAGEPPRTGSEQREFAALWAALGVALVGGDRFYSCPLHADPSRSLHVDAEGCRWYCFSCHEGGGAARVRALVTERLGPDAAGEITEGISGVAEPDQARATWLRWPTLAPGDTQAVVGEAEHQEALEVAAGGRTWHGAAIPLVTATLRRSADDVRRPRAVAVEIGGMVVGHLPTEDAPEYEEFLDESAQTGHPTTARARITGGWDRGPKGRGWFGLELDVKRPTTPCDKTGAFLPAGPPVAVLGEEAHQEPLRKHVVAGHADAPTAELIVADDGTVRVHIDGEEVGHLGERRGQRYRELVSRVEQAGFPATCAASVIEGKLKVEVYVLLPGPDTLERLLESG